MIHNFNRYAQHVSLEKVKRSRFRGEVSEGRCWQTPLAKLSLGDIHIEPSDPEHALFSDLIVNVWGYKAPLTIVASSYDSQLPTQDLRKLLTDDMFVRDAIGRVLATYDLPEPLYD